MLNPSAFKSK